MTDIIQETSGHYCTKCEFLCEMYEQGLSCRCDPPWETEVVDEREYPAHWIPVRILVMKDHSAEVAKLKWQMRWIYETVHGEYYGETIRENIREVYPNIEEDMKHE